MDLEFGGNSYLTEQFTESERIFREASAQQWDDQPSVLAQNRTHFGQLIQNPFRQWNPHDATAQIENPHDATAQIENPHDATAQIGNHRNATAWIRNPRDAIVWSEYQFNAPTVRTRSFDDDSVANDNIPLPWPSIFNPNGSNAKIFPPVSNRYVKVWKNGGPWEVIPEYVLKIGQRMESQLCDILEETNERIKKLEDRNALLTTENGILRSQLNEVIAMMKQTKHQ